MAQSFVSQVTQQSPAGWTYAQWAAQQLGINPIAVFTQWVAEQGLSEAETAEWPNNNPAGLKIASGDTVGPNAKEGADKLAVGVDSSGFLIFSGPQEGVAGYVARWQDPIYKSYLTDMQNSYKFAPHTSYNSTGDVLDIRKELADIAASPWDAGHYTDKGIQGQKLFEDYQSIAKNPWVNNPFTGLPGAVAGMVNGTVSDLTGGETLAQFLGINWDFKTFLFILLGAILAMILIYRLVTQ